jgi:molybdopterin/thiamine biosynthesis adenylyltransferase/proteasome lid subunit RPN8/RPN11
MNAITLVLPEQLADQLAAAAQDEAEMAAVLLVGVARDQDRLRLLGRELHWVDETAYTRRDALGMSITSVGYVRALARAAELGAVALWAHTHPRGTPTPSPHDRAVDEQLQSVFTLRTGQDLYGSVVIAPAEPGNAAPLQFTGRITEDGQEREVARLWIVGARFQPVVATGMAETETLDPFDRQVRALGPAMQSHLAQLRIGLIGAGGTGSAVGEQLARLGVGELLVVDPDILSTSNITRVHGATLADVGRPKADVLAAHAAAIGLGTRVEPIVGSILSPGTAARLRGCDLVFGCTDDNAGRVVLSRFSTYYLTPVIDCGVLVSSVEGALTGIDARVTMLSPGYACLLCRNRIDLRRAALEQLNPEERTALQREGYAPELAGVEPAVVAYTTLVAALSVNEMLERLVGYGIDPPPGELLARIHDRELSTNTRTANPGHYCADGSAARGTGDREPFLEMTWASA